MKKCKITVLKRNFDEELAREYGVEGLTACPMLKVGQKMVCFKSEMCCFVSDNKLPTCVDNLLNIRKICVYTS